jgi:16S rRNA (guanine527-N7)-methyltransferase
MPATGNAEVEAQAALQLLSAEWGFRVDPEQTASLLQFAELLIHWNRSINLTGAKSTGAVVAEHYPDAYALARRLDGPARLVDVGSGGGLPALPLALLRPALVIRLCEPIAKKAAFLRTAIRELKLSDRVTLETSRGEELADSLADALSQRFDVATSRATFAPEGWLALGRRLVRPGGRVFILTVPGTAIEGRADIYGDRKRLLIEVSIEAPV